MPQHDPETPDEPATARIRKAPRRNRFEPAGGLIATQIRKAGEARGFAVSRILTQWTEVAGPELAALCRPQRISYAKRGFGATLVLEASGAAAPLVAMRIDGLRERINAVYGYAAIARIQLVQVAGLMAVAGMAEAQSPFTGPPGAVKSDNLTLPTVRSLERARAVVETLTEGVADPGLKSALDRLAENVLRRNGPVVPGGAPKERNL